MTPEGSRRQQLNALKVNENKVQCRNCQSDAVWRVQSRAAGEGRGRVHQGQEGLGEGREGKRGTTG